MKEKAILGLDKSKSFLEKIKFFFQEVQLETKKVSWPERKVVFSFFVVVIFILFLLTVFIWGADIGLLRLIDYLIVKF